MIGKIILLIMKTILRIVKIILLIVGLETGYAERSRIFVQASAIELAHIAERSRKSQRKCQEKVHLYETFAHVPLYAIFPPKNPSYPSLMTYLFVYKCVVSV